MAAEISPQLQQILDRFGTELESYIEKEVAKQVKAQTTAEVESAAAAQPAAITQPASAAQPTTTTLPTTTTNDEKVAASPPKTAEDNWQNMSDYDRMFTLLDRVKNKHHSQP